MEQQDLEISVQQEDAIQCLRDFIRRLGQSVDDSTKARTDSKPANISCFNLKKLPVATLNKSLKPPF